MRAESKVRGDWVPHMLAYLLSPCTGVSAALVHSLSEFLIDSASCSDSQAKLIKLVKQPDYFSEFKEKPELSSYLGSSILAKLAFAGAVSLVQSKPLAQLTFVVGRKVFLLENRLQHGVSSRTFAHELIC